MTTAPDHDHSLHDRSGRIYFAVPFAHRDRARQLGAEWDAARGAWFAAAGANVAALAVWQTPQPAIETEAFTDS